MFKTYRMAELSTTKRTISILMATLLYLFICSLDIVKAESFANIVGEYQSNVEHQFRFVQDWTEQDALKVVEEYRESMKTILDENEDPNDPCNPKHCHARFEHVFQAPVQLPCSTASGEIPNAAHLPLVYAGDYDQCNRVFMDSGHYCTIDTFTEFVAIPIRKGTFKYTGEGFVLGRLHLGRCVSKQCTSTLLRKSFLAGLKATAKKIQRRLPLDLYIPYVENTIINSTIVRCVDEDEKKMGSVWDHANSIAMVIFCLGLFAMVIFATVYDIWYIEDDSQSSKSSARTLIHALSAKKSIHSLLTPMTGDFLPLNGIRVVSTVWIVYGHVVLYSSGLALPFPVLNPSAIDTQVQSFYIMLSRAAEYAVDTFFFMTAFLAVWGRLLEEEAKPSKGYMSTYFRLVLLRYLRLTPIYAFVLFFYMNVFPYMGTGPFYHAVQGTEFRNVECKYWWTNLIYINNLYPYGEEGGLRGCAGWTWYLANDFQYYIMLVPCVWIFIYFHKKAKDDQNLISLKPISIINWKYFFLGCSPALALWIIQLISTFTIMQEYEIHGSFDTNYNVHLYVKPWCRIAPFAVGMIYGYMHFVRRNTNWKDSVFFNASPTIVVLLAVVIMCIIAFSTFDEFRCKADENDCRIFSGFTRYGALIGANWSEMQLTWYFTLTYGAWAVCLGVVFLYFFAGHGGIVHSFLSHPWFVPLARLSYSVYLIHIPVIQYLYLTSPSPLFVSIKMHFVDSIALTLVAFTLAFLLYIFVERPVMSLVSLVLSRSTRNPRTAATATLTTTNVTTPLNHEARGEANGTAAQQQPLLG